MTTYEFSGKSTAKLMPEHKMVERRAHRRHNLEPQMLEVGRWDGKKQGGPKLGQVLDLSSGGLRIRTSQPNIRPDQQIRIKLDLPTYAGISPFVDVSTEQAKPKSEWVGWLAVSRVHQVDKFNYDVAGRLMDMDDLDRGMLGLYLSTQPLAA